MKSKKLEIEQRILEMIKEYLNSLPDERRTYLNTVHTENLKNMQSDDEPMKYTYLAQDYRCTLKDIITYKIYISFVNGKLSAQPFCTSNDIYINDFEIALNGIMRCIENLEKNSTLKEQVLESLFKGLFYQEIVNMLISETTKTDYMGIYPFEDIDWNDIILARYYLTKPTESTLDGEISFDENLSGRPFNQECSKAYQTLEYEAQKYIIDIGERLANSSDIFKTIRDIDAERQNILNEVRNNIPQVSPGELPDSLEDLFLCNMIERRDSSGKGTYVNPFNIPELDMKKRTHDNLTEKQHQLQSQILERGLLGVLVKSIIQGIEEEIEIENNSPRQKVYSQYGS